MSMEAWATPASELPSRAPARPYEPRATATPPAASRLELLSGDVPFRPMGVAEMLDGAIAGIRRNARAVLGLSVVITAGIQVLLTVGSYLFIGEGARDELTPIAVMRSLGAQATLGAIGLLLSAFGILLLAGLLSPVIGRTMFGRPPATLGQAWRDVRPRLWPLVGTATLVMTVSLLALIVPVLPFFLFVAADAPTGAGVLAAVIGFPVGLGLMVWLYVLYVLAIPAVVLERQGVVHSMRRAHQLSRGRWWRTCGTLLLTVLITSFMGFFALRVPFLLFQAIAFGSDPTGTALLLSLTVDTLGRIVSWSLIGPFDAGVIALIYVDRRMRREGFDLEVLTDPSAASAASGASVAAGASGASATGTPAESADAPDTFFDLWRPSPLVPPPGTPSAPAIPPPPGLLDHMRPDVVHFPSPPPGYRPPAGHQPPVGPGWQPAGPGGRPR